MSYSIRSFRRKDAQEVKEVALKSWEYTYYHQKPIFTPEQIKEFNENWYSIAGLEGTVKHIKEGWTRFTVLEEDNSKQIIGFAQIGFQNYNDLTNLKSPLILYRIYLHPNYIGQGLGIKLLENMEDFVRQNNRHYYICFVHKENKLGISFYEKHGFEHWKEKDTVDEFCYGKTLIT